MTRLAFARARFVRLYPAFVTCAALSLAWECLCVGHSPLTLHDLALNLTMLPQLLGVQPIDGVYWTLGYELCFYAVVWAALPWINGKTNATHVYSRKSQFVYNGNVLRFDRYVGSSYSLLCRMCHLLFSGRIIWWLVAASLPLLYWQPLVGWFLLGVMLHECRAISLSVWFYNRRHLVFSLWCTRYMVAPCLWLGAVSYPLYLLHCVIGRSLVLALAPATGAWEAVAAVSGTMIALAWAVHVLVERPAQRWLRGLRWSGRLRWRTA